MSVLPLTDFVARIHAASGQMVLALTGGGSRAIADLLTVPGGSRTLLEAVVPYSAASLEEFLHARPEQFCSPRTARMMAMAAFSRAPHLQTVASEAAAISDPLPATSGESTLPPPIGIGCTASLASDRPKRGPHRIHVALQTADMTVTYSLELIKDRRTRAQEENIAAQVVLNAVAEAFGLSDRLPLPLIENEKVESSRTVAQLAWRDLLLGNTRVVAGIGAHTAPGDSPEAKLSGTNSNEKKSGIRRAIFPGAFNPLHDGHLRMAEVAVKRLGLPVEFELSIENVDKPPLDYTEIDQRAAQFKEKNLSLWLTRAPTFEEKSQLFSGATFIVGADTIARIGQPRYYGDDFAAMEAALERIAQRGCRFLVFGRVAGNQFQSCADLSLPDALRKLCDDVPNSEFRSDISSTELRRQEIESPEL